jgi:pimeloyl-ACP methyl ester carboxylesterase
VGQNDGVRERKRANSIRVLATGPTGGTVAADAGELPDAVAVSPVIGPTAVPKFEARQRPPRLARFTIELDDGHQVGVAVCGQGVPLVVVHGFSAEGFLYAQTLTRLVAMGFKVIAIDTAGHGTTMGLPTGGADLSAYTKLLGRALDELGIERAVVAGHSMGGRLATELAANEPDRVIALILIDAIVGPVWDRYVNASRLMPPLLAGTGSLLWLDALTTVPMFRDPVQAVKLGKLLVPTITGHVRRPWRLVGPAVSIMRSRSSSWMLERLALLEIPVCVLHGDRDAAIPLCVGRATAEKSGGDLVVIHGGTHSWLLKDPETLPAVMAHLLDGRLGRAIDAELVAAGLDPAAATPAEIDEVLYEPDSGVIALTPPSDGIRDDRYHPAARYRWSVVA